MWAKKVHEIEFQDEIDEDLEIQNLTIDEKDIDDCSSVENDSEAGTTDSEPDDTTETEVAQHINEGHVEGECDTDEVKCEDVSHLGQDIDIVQTSEHAVLGNGNEQNTVAKEGSTADVESSRQAAAESVGRGTSLDYPPYDDPENDCINHDEAQLSEGGIV